MKNLPAKILAVIPARGGSKGLPRKNLLPLAGKPLIAWTIESALAAESISRVIVTTDDDEIADVAKSYGAEVPFMRPDRLATDCASGVDVLIHAVESAQNHYREIYDWVFLLQPTSPLRCVGDIDSAYSMIDENVDSIIGVKEVEEYPQWMKSMGEDGGIKDLFEELEITQNRQDLDIPYIVNGAIYLVRVPNLLRDKKMSGAITKGYIMAKDRSVDIDDFIDFKLAELLMNEK